MSFRTRVRVAFLILTLIPLAVLAFVLRREVESRLLEQAEAQIASLVAVMRQDLAHETEEIRSRLAAIGLGMQADNRLRAILAGGSTDRTYLLDYAESAVDLTGLEMLQLQTSDGRIVSSGHFRNEFDRLEPDLPAMIRAAPGRIALVEARSPNGPFLALVAVDRALAGSSTLDLVGGVTIGEAFLERLARESELTVTLRYPDAQFTTGGAAGDISSAQDGRSGTASLRDTDGSIPPFAELAVPFVRAGDPAPPRQATFEIRSSSTTLLEIRRSTSRWFLAVIGGTALVALLGATWLASLVTRPLEDLAARASRIELDRRDVRFATGRKDEVGKLSRLLERMTERLRASAGRLREAERQVTLGEIARQVNHDIKNGLAPIRNVVTHLTQVGTDDPPDLPRVFRERSGTLASSIAYLEQLAGNYGRIGGRPGVGPSDLNGTAHEVVASVSGDVRGRIELQCDEGVLHVACEAVALRRILENLVANALDSLAGPDGNVVVRTRPIENGNGPGASLSVADNGAGMTEGELTQAFEDFYTTKEGGTGLGLSVVRRLVMDANGSVRTESRPGQGSTFTVELPGIRNGPLEAPSQTRVP